MKTIDLGLMRYRDALRQMDELHSKIVAEPNSEERLLFVEHPAVVTMGNRERDSDMLFSGEALKARGVDFEKIDRGGSVTVHEPGQIVVYPLVRIDARRRTVKSFVWSLEEAMIRTAASFGVEAARDPINPGIWCGPNKLGALGIRVANHVSKHGLAFNVTNSLATFDLVVPCGIRGRGVTSLQRELSKKSIEAPALSDVKRELESHLRTLLQ